MATDQPVLVEMIQQMAEESEGKRLDEETLTGGISAVFEDAGRGAYWVVSDESAVAIGCLLVTTEWSDWHNRDYWWVQSVYVQPDHRGKGALGVLLDAVEESARQAGVAEVRLYVDLENDRAAKAYHKLGFGFSSYQVMGKKLNE